MREIEVIEYQKEFPTMNLTLMKNNPKEYDMSILVAYTLETKRGFIVKKQYKTTRKGTKFTYKGCKDKAEAELYKSKLNELLEEYNRKYKTNYCW